jgi:hypothetical protein
MTTKSITELSFPIKIVGPIIATTVAATMWLQAQLWEIKAAMGTAWTIHDQREWAAEAAAKNPNHHIPNPDEVFWKGRNKHYQQSSVVGFDATLATKQ